MRSDFEFQQQLGRGSFGVVYKVVRRSDRQSFVCKEIILQGISQKARDEANQEVKLLRKVSSGSRYIVQYICSFLEEESLHIIMEFCERGDLSDYLKKRDGLLLEEPTIWKFTIQISLGLRWLHQNRILHRDIKAMNVFLTSSDDVRLGDLGVARVLSNSTHFANTLVGTPYYLSPELCEEKPYNELSDVWALGCVIYEMCCQKHPFQASNQAALLIKILRGQYAPISDAYTDDLRQLIDGCMNRDWRQRTKLVTLLESAPVQRWASELELSLVETAPIIAAAAFAAVNFEGVDQHHHGSARANSKDVPTISSPPATARVPVRRLKDTGRAAPRVRVRRVPVPADGRSSGAPTIVAAPVQLVAPVAVVRAHPGKPRHRAKPYPQESAGGPPPAPRPASGAHRAPVLTAEQQRRAAREVADLPDIVPALSKTARRNPPTVRQLKQFEDYSSSQQGRQQQHHQHYSYLQREPEEEHEQLTLLPTDLTMLAEDLTLRPDDPEAQLQIEQSDPNFDHQVVEPSSLRLLQPRPPRPEEALEVTGCSAFEDSLALSATAASSLPELSIAHHREGGHALHEKAEELSEELEVDEECCDDGEEAVSEVPSGSENYEHEDREDADDNESLPEVVIGMVQMNWSIGGENTGSEGQLALPKLDSNGLLCDPTWGAPMQPHLGKIGADACSRSESEAGDDAEIASERHLPEDRGGANHPQAQMDRLTKQIGNLYDQVLEALDEPARAVWDELYQLFKAKMQVDLTEEDQSDIERYVFESLPMQNSELVWKVYKVLHLEQERDRWQKVLSGTAFRAPG